jgi:hypothetical protein
MKVWNDFLLCFELLPNPDYFYGYSFGYDCIKWRLNPVEGSKFYPD